MRPVAAGAAETVYVDLLDPRRLDAVREAMGQFLASNRRDFWPSTVHTAAPSDTDTSDAELKPCMVIVPLDRLGGQQGFSGASVLISYYMDDGGTFLPSKPVVVKVGDPRNLSAELRAARAWPRHFSGEDGRFAYPVHYYDNGLSDPGCAVLVAPFSSEGALNTDQTGWQLRLLDLWQLLHARKQNTDSILGIITELYKLIHGMHRDGRVRCRRSEFSYDIEYKRYLRGMEQETSPLAEDLFGSADTTRFFGLDWINPRRVVAEVLRHAPFEGASGPVHGDLHPKNIVLDTHLVPHVIDFGWATESGHVVRDYVLMEINLRAMTLPAGARFSDILALARTLNPADAVPETGLITRQRISLIRDGIWQQANGSGIVGSWNAEYLIPLLLVSYGLLHHLDSARNQVSLLLTVLAAAERVASFLDL